MISSHTTVPNTSEGQVVIGKLNDGIVGYPTSKRIPLKKMIDEFFSFGKNIKSQGTLPVFHDLVNFIFLAVGYDGQYGSKNFFLHKVAV